MKTALVIGMNKTGTTIVASVLRKSIPGSMLGMEPKLVAHLEQHATMTQPIVVKILYEHWMQRPNLLTGIVRGETGFRPDRTVAIIRDPRDGLISALMYSVYAYVQNGATREQVNAWVDVLRGKEADPDKHSLLNLMESRARIFGIGPTPDFFFEAFASYSEWVAEESEYFHILSYEDFVAGNVEELTAYLGVELSTSRDVDPGAQRVTRSRQAENWRVMMLPEDVAYWKERYGDILADWGYTDWDIRPEHTDPAVGSEYVLRIADEAFKTFQAKPAAPARPTAPVKPAFMSWNVGKK
jgi:hypothetical protein